MTVRAILTVEPSPKPCEEARMTIQYHITAQGHRIAYQHQPGSSPGVLFCGGFRSDMTSGKATALAAWCAEHGVAFTRFDYFAHGKSDGAFEDFTIGGAIACALEMLDHVATGDQIVVGSSMGGWIALHAALERKGQVRGMVALAAAPDFSERLMFAQMTPEQRRTLEEEGTLWVPGDYASDEYPITQQFITEARQHLVLDDSIALEIPLHIIHGQMDMVVPWETALLLARCWMGERVTVTLVKDGEHRLNRPEDVALLLEAVTKLRE